MPSKICTKCATKKDYSLYSKDRHTSDGITTACKDCRNSYKRWKRANDPATAKRERAAMKKFRENNSKDIKEKAAKFKRRNPEIVLAYAQKYRDNNADKVKGAVKKSYYKHKEKILKSAKKWRQDNPEKTKAHTAVLNATRRGAMVKFPCCVCNSNKSEAHHSDYSKPLDVTWFCHKHHMEWHRKND